MTQSIRKAPLMTRHRASPRPVTTLHIDLREPFCHTRPAGAGRLFSYVVAQKMTRGYHPSGKTALHDRPGRMSW